MEATVAPSEENPIFLAGLGAPEHPTFEPSMPIAYIPPELAFGPGELEANSLDGGSGE
ncbi:MAG: hypothetical protein L3K13_02245 [Thermoplasmata archaeon]|nr:hypothetical protein [Thermoplasmata archaeon]